MTLEEIHEQLENIQREMTDDRFMYLDSEIELNGELIKIVEELKVYTRALELACNIIENHAYCPCICDGNRSCIDCLLQKARGEENV